jgi:hypothetical protein
MKNVEMESTAMMVSVTKMVVISLLTAGVTTLSTVKEATLPLIQLKSLLLSLNSLLPTTLTMVMSLK